MSLLTREFNWSTVISASPQKISRELVKQVFSSLKPSLGQKLESIAMDAGDQGINFLLSTFSVAVKFGEKLESLVGEKDAAISQPLFQGVCIRCRLILYRIPAYPTKVQTL